ncbi:DUF1501 domain-containing protein [Urbifossiella limnaea]|uniref:DUF1501 domain-containing protein n=1 Tax=Urbifossiella limnaea TaxID=2528023 RepID=A0A517XQI0_9BACT|nr:DUF1501 domain-containing protein [Urbifossiella limnaea]QDU19761.1 hypothetical protein ETAA1_16980 [Urbifossiella limnaea]
MLTIHDRGFARDCRGASRREFLRVGGLGLGLSGLTLPGLLAARARAGESGGAPKKAVVLLFLQGGPSQLETWDPKPEAPKEYRTHTDCIVTAHPGVRFCRYFPRLAAMARDFTVVRNFASGNGGHTYEAVTTGGNATKGSLSAASAYLGGAVAPSGLPGNMLVLPEAVQEGLKLGSNFETGALPTLTQTGSLGSQYEAFSPAGGSKLKQAMTLTLPRERFDDRRQLLAGFDTLRRDIDRGGALGRADEYQQRAFDIISRGITEVFDLGKEDPRTLAMYDTAGLFRLEDATRWYDMKRASNLLGKQMLLARRLCEAGCGFVTVSDCGWDMHANNNSPKNMEGLKWLAPQVDHAVAAFLEDVKQRGLSEKILLVVTGEMGRSPRLNGNGGRDHHGELTPLLIAGGGLKMGQVVGRSDALGGRPASHGYRPAHLFATVMNFLLDVPQLRLRTDLNRDLMTAIDRANVIRELF